jgi:DNA-binding XRE family transcriptional regulator
MTLQEARKAKGWSPRELDAKASIPVGTTYDIESGRNKNPSWAIVSGIVGAFHKAGLVGLTAHDLFPAAQTEVRS